MMQRALAFVRRRGGRHFRGSALTSAGARAQKFRREKDKSVVSGCSHEPEEPNHLKKRLHFTDSNL